MKRLMTTFAVAAALSVAAQAQDIKTETKVKTDDAKTTTYTGCVAAGTDASSYVLENAVPMKDKDKDKNDTKSDSTSKYVLVPSGTVTFEKNVGQKVEVTAVVIPAGDDKSKVETTTKTKVEGQPEQKTEVKETIAQRDFPQLRVVAVKYLADHCSPSPSSR